MKDSIKALVEGSILPHYMWFFLLPQLSYKLKNYEHFNIYVNGQYVIPITNLPSGISESTEYVFQNFTTSQQKYI